MRPCGTGCASGPAGGGDRPLPFDFKGKKDMFGKDDYKKIPNGAPGIETLLMVVHSEGVAKGPHQPGTHGGRAATGTARMFGLKDKGEIAVGKDADIVVFDPKQKFTSPGRNST